MGNILLAKESTSIPRGLHCGLNSGTQSHNLDPLPTTVNGKGLAISKEEVKSLDDRYHLCYTIELSDSSDDGDKKGPPARSEGINFQDNLGFNNTHYGRHYIEIFTLMWYQVEGSLVLIIMVTITFFTEFDDFVSDEDPIQEHIVERQPSERTDLKWKVLDHSSSPLHAMTFQQLRRLFLSLKQQLNGKSAYRRVLSFSTVDSTVTHITISSRGYLPLPPAAVPPLKPCTYLHRSL